MTDDDSTLLVNGDIVPCDESDCDISLSVVRPVAADGSSSPGAQRRKRLCKLRDSLKCRDNVDMDHTNADADSIYADNLPEVLLHVTSVDNILVYSAFAFPCFLHKTDAGEV